MTCHQVAGRSVWGMVPHVVYLGLLGAGTQLVGTCVVGSCIGFIPVITAMFIHTLFQHWGGWWQRQADLLCQCGGLMSSIRSALWWELTCNAKIILVHALSHRSSRCLFLNLLLPTFQIIFFQALTNQLGHCPWVNVYSSLQPLIFLYKVEDQCVTWSAALWKHCCLLGHLRVGSIAAA